MMKSLKNGALHLVVVLSALFITACSSPITYPVHFDNVSFDKVNKTTHASSVSSTDRNKIAQLSRTIMGLGPDIDKSEADYVAHEAVLYPQHLANSYRLMWPPNYQNVLVNSGKRERGLCYHWAQDMTAHIGTKHYNTLSMIRAVANQGTEFEHNVLTVAAKGKGIKDAYILDAWRNSGSLLVYKTTEDPDYDWIKYYPLIRQAQKPSH